jgi:major vault protein
MNKIEALKFKNIVESLGPETLVEIARAGPELQAKLLQGLNLNGYILTDGNNPINLFNVANSKFISLTI